MSSRGCNEANAQYSCQGSVQDQAGKLSFHPRHVAKSSGPLVLAGPGRPPPPGSKKASRPLPRLGLAGSRAFYHCPVVRRPHPPSPMVSAAAMWGAVIIRPSSFQPGTLWRLSRDLEPPTAPSSNKESLHLRCDQSLSEEADFHPDLAVVRWHPPSPRQSSVIEADKNRRIKYDPESYMTPKYLDFNQKSYIIPRNRKTPKLI